MVQWLNRFGNENCANGLLLILQNCCVVAGLMVSWLYFGCSGEREKIAKKDKHVCIHGRKKQNTHLGCVSTLWAVYVHYGCIFLSSTQGEVNLSVSV